jgi:hypothetical protein
MGRMARMAATPQIEIVYYVAASLDCATPNKWGQINISDP